MRLVAIVAVLGALTPCSMASASVISYSDRTAWLASSNGVVTIDFENIAPSGSFVFYSTPPGVTLSGVNFDVNAGTNLFIVDAAYDSAYDRGSGSDLSWQNGGPLPNVLTVTLPAGTSAIGADFFSLISDSSLLMTLSTGESFIIPAPGYLNGMSFFGLTSTATISSVTVQQPLGVTELYFALDNFSFGAADETDPVPEPATVLLLGAGLAFVAKKRMRA